MARYGAQLRNNILRRILDPQRQPIKEVAKEFGISEATIYNWKARLNNGTLQVDDGAQGARYRQISEKLSLVLESKGRLVSSKLSLFSHYARLSTRLTSGYRPTD